MPDYQTTWITRHLSHDNQKKVQFTTVEEIFCLQNKLKKAAKEYVHAMGTPSIQDLKTIFTMSLVKDNEIILKDIDIAKNADGPDIGCIKGKTTRRNKKESDNDMIEIPKELIRKNWYLEISVDTINLNGLTFFTSISHELYYRTVQYIPNTKSSTFW